MRSFADFLGWSRRGLGAGRAHLARVLLPEVPSPKPTKLRPSNLFGSCGLTLLMTRTWLASVYVANAHSIHPHVITI